MRKIESCAFIVVILISLVTISCEKDTFVDEGDYLYDNYSLVPYGNQNLNQDLIQGLPEVYTHRISMISNSVVRCGGDVTSVGSSPVSSRGVCWGTAPFPTVQNDHTLDGSGSGSFISTISSLNSETTYYFRAFATNNSGTAYGKQVCITTSVSK